MRLGLAAKIIIPIQVAFAFAIASAIVLNYYKMEKVTQDTVASRFQVIASGLDRQIEDSLNLGFSLTSLRNLEGLVGRERAHDARIGSIVLFDGRGGVVTASGGTVKAGGRVPAAWLQADLATRGSSHAWSLVDGSTQVIGATLRNAFGQPEGGIALTYSLSGLRALVRGTLPALIETSVVNLLLCMAVTALVVWLMVRRTAERLDRVGDRLEGRAGGDDGADEKELGLHVGAFLGRVAEVREVMTAVVKTAEKRTEDIADAGAGR